MELDHSDRTAANKGLPCTSNLPHLQQGAASELSDPSALEGFEGGRRGRQREASSEQTRGTSQQGSHTNRCAGLYLWACNWGLCILPVTSALLREVRLYLWACNWGLCILPVTSALLPPCSWMELVDGWAIKTVYKSTLAHNQCPIAGGGVWGWAFG